MAGWTKANVRHVASLFRRGGNPAATVYESIGADFFLAVAPGWLNLGLWESGGDPAEAPVAPRRLVDAIARALPPGGVVLDVGNGLGTQDAVIAEVARPRGLVALNVTEWQLRAGRDAMRAAGAVPVAADATRIPLANASVDGVISVEAAFHFGSREWFFAEARRVLRPGGVLTMSDVGVERMPRGPREAVAGALNLRFWGIRARSLMSVAEIARAATSAGFAEVVVERVGDRVIDPALAFSRARLRDARGVPLSQVLGARFMVRQCRLLRRRGMIEYVLLRARAA